MSKISRRDFLKGAAGTAAGIAALGVMNVSAAEEAAAEVNYAAEAGYHSAWDWLGAAPSVADSEIAGTVDVDVVVVGGGNAGVCAALAAAEGGAKVAVIEEQDAEVFTCLGHDIGTLNSAWVLANGGEAIDPVEFMSDWQRRNMCRCNNALVQQYTYRSGEVLDWYLSHLPQAMVDNLGVFGNPYPKNYPGEISGYKSFASAVHFSGEGTDLPDAVKTLKAASEALGAVWYMGHSGLVLLKDGARVSGVIAKRLEDDAYVKFNAAKAVVLAAGDFGGNPDMVFALNDEYRSFVEIRKQDYTQIRGMSRKGQGHKMGIWAGGHMEPGPRAAMTHANGAAAFGALAMLHLNRDGKRFMDEGMMAAFGGYFNIMRQPRGNIYCVIDNQWREFVEYNALEHVYPGTGGKNDGGFLATLETEIPKVLGTGSEGYKIRGKMTYAAETLEEAADFAGLSGEAKENFLASVARYNELCEKGRDEDFGKDAALLMPIKEPPFYISVDNVNEKFSLGLVELSGLMVDENQCVLDDQDDPIPGLYATGNCCGGRYGISYQTPIAGNSIGWAVTMGKIVGDTVAKL